MASRVVDPRCTNPDPTSLAPAPQVVGVAQPSMVEVTVVGDGPDVDERESQVSEVWRQSQELGPSLAPVPEHGVVSAEKPPMTSSTATTTFSQKPTLPIAITVTKASGTSNCSSRPTPPPLDTQISTSSQASLSEAITHSKSVANSWAQVAARAEKEAIKRRQTNQLKVWDSNLMSPTCQRRTLEQLQSPRAIEAVMKLQKVAQESKAKAGTARLAKGWAQVAVAAEKAARLRYFEARTEAADINTEIMAPIAVGSKVTYYSEEKKEYVEAVVRGPYDPITGTYNLNVDGMARADQVFRDQVVPNHENEAKLMEIFHMCDSHNEQRASLFELKTIVQNDNITAEFFGIPKIDNISGSVDEYRQREAFIESLFGSVHDESTDQRLTWPEFCVWAKRHDDGEKTLMAIFDKLDIDKDGTVSLEELTTLVARDATVAHYFNIPSADKEKQQESIREIFRSVDQNGDNQLTWAEFRIWNARNQALIETTLPRAKKRSLFQAMCLCGVVFDENDRFCRKCGKERGKARLSISDLQKQNAEAPKNNNTTKLEDSDSSSDDEDHDQENHLDITVPKSSFLTTVEDSAKNDTIGFTGITLGNGLSASTPRTAKTKKKERRRGAQTLFEDFTPTDSSEDEQPLERNGKSKKRNSLGAHAYVAFSEELYNSQVAKVQATIQMHTQRLHADLASQVKTLQYEWCRLSSQACLTTPRGDAALVAGAIGQSWQMPQLAADDYYCLSQTPSTFSQNPSTFSQSPSRRARKKTKPLGEDGMTSVATDEYALDTTPSEKKVRIAEEDQPPNKEQPSKAAEHPLQKTNEVSRSTSVLNRAKTGLGGKLGMPSMSFGIGAGMAAAKKSPACNAPKYTRMASQAIVNTKPEDTIVKEPPRPQEPHVHFQEPEEGKRGSGLMMRKLEKVNSLSSAQSRTPKTPGSSGPGKKDVEQALVQSAQTKRNGPQFNKPRSVMPDTGEMKARVRECLEEKKYDVKDLYKGTGVMQGIAKSPKFETMTLMVITLNSLWIAFEIDYNNKPLISAEPQFVIVENFFCVYFFGEWFIRFCAFKRKIYAATDSSFCFDTALAWLMVFETWVITLITWATATDSASELGSTSVLKLLKFLRLTRMARIVRLLRELPELIVLLKGIGIACRSVGFCCFLLFVLTYMFAIAITQMSKETILAQKYFDTVPDAMKHMLIAAIFPDLFDMFDDIGYESWFTLAIFIVFIFLTALVVMNMIVGVLVEVIKVVSETEKEELMVRVIKDEMNTILLEFDKNGNGLISNDEFIEVLVDPCAVKFLTAVGIDVVALVEYLDVLFKNGKSYSHSELIGLVLDMRGSNACTYKDIVDLRKWIDKEFDELRDWWIDFAEDVYDDQMAKIRHLILHTSEKAPLLALPTNRDGNKKLGERSGESLLPSPKSGKFLELLR